ILTTTYVAAIQKVVPVPTVSADARRGTKVYRLDQVKKYMVVVQVDADEKGRPRVRVEKEEVAVLGGDGRSVDVDKLATVLRPLVRGDPPKSEMLLDARGVSWGTVIAVQDAAKTAGVRVVHFLVQSQKKTK